MTSPLITGYVQGLHRNLPAALADEAADLVRRLTA